MINYEIVTLRGQEQFNLNGVRFGNKSFMFWKKKSTSVIRQIVVIFDKKYESINVNDGVMILSLKGLNNYQDLRNAIMIFIQILRDNRMNIEMHFVIENENQKQVAEALGREFGVSYEVQMVNQNSEQQLKNMEQQLKKNNELSSGGNQMIDKYDNGSLSKITIHNGSAYENNGLLNSEEEKLSLLREWMQDPVKAQKLMNMSEEERNELLTQEVLSGRKQYRLEDTNQQLANDRASEVAMNVASREGGLVNSELSLVQHTDFRANQYSVVEKNGDNVQVVAPNVTKAQVSMSGISNSGGVNAGDNSNIYGDVNMREDDDEQRNLEEQIFYIDEERNIWNNSSEMVGKLGNDGYRIDYEDNSLLRYEQMVGYIGDYKDMGKSTSKERSNVRRKVLEKKEDTNNVGFVSLPVIMFVLSAMLLISSLVLLFVLD